MELGNAFVILLERIINDNSKASLRKPLSFIQALKSINFLQEFDDIKYAEHLLNIGLLGL